MIEITAAALIELRQMCRQAKCRGPVAQRLVAGQYGRLQFVHDNSGDWSDDVTFEDNEGVLMVIDAALHDELDDLILDYEDRRGARLLNFRHRPKES